MTKAKPSCDLVSAIRIMMTKSCDEPAVNVYLFLWDKVIGLRLIFKTTMLAPQACLDIADNLYSNQVE